MVEWRFRLTSTNNNVNNYEIETIPFPSFPTEASRVATTELDAELSQMLRCGADANSWLAWTARTPDRWVAHDQMVILSREMAESVHHFEAEKSRFRRDVEEICGISETDGFASIVGRTKIDDFVPHFRSNSALLSFEDVAAILRKNQRLLRNKLGGPVVEELNTRYEQACDRRKSLRQRLQALEFACDCLLGGCCGLTANDIQQVRSTIQKHQ